MKNIVFQISILFLAFTGCEYSTVAQYKYSPPELTSDGLMVGTLDEVNIDSRYIRDAIVDIIGGKFREVHSLIIHRRGKLVLEEYFPGHSYKWDGANHYGEWVEWNRDVLHMIASDSKSITSACIGIAVDQGFIKSVHQSIFDYLPDYKELNKDGKDKITIEHLLTMTSGLEANEWQAPYSSPANDVIALWFPPCEDPITCILEKPLVREPGTYFNYFGGNMILLGEILKNASGMNIDQFSKKYLFSPMGIDSINWSLIFPNGVYESAGGLELTPRAMLKIGVLYLNNGVWEGEKILSEEWIKKSASSYGNNMNIKIPGTDGGRNGYGYSWWVKDYSTPWEKTSMYYACGWGGQYIMVFPELETVVVFTGANYTSRVRNFRILEKYILPAID